MPRPKRFARRCSGGRHVITTPGLALRSLTVADLPLAAAAASDREAQRWLGWKREDLVAGEERDRLLSAPPGRGRARFGLPSRCVPTGMVAVDPDNGLPAGILWLTPESPDLCELGGYLAPSYRGRGARSGAVRGGSRARPGASPLHRGAGRCAAREREVRPVAVEGRSRPGLRSGEACAPGRAGHTVRLVLLRRAGPHVVRVRLVNVPGFAQATCGMTRDSAEVTSSGAGATSGTTSRRASQPLIAWTVGFASTS